jgi:hypothetical protein
MVVSNKLVASTSDGLILLALAVTLSLAGEAAAQAPAAQTPQPTPQQTPASSTATEPSQPARAPSVPPQRRKQRAYRAQTLDDRVEALAKALDLNQMQRAGLKAVLEHQRSQARQIQFDETISGEERIAKFRALQEDTVLRIRALLNDEQKKKYEPLNHQAGSANSSDSYIGDWMRYHERTEQPPPAPKK